MAGATLKEISEDHIETFRYCSLEASQVTQICITPLACTAQNILPSPEREHSSYQTQSSIIIILYKVIVS